MNDQMSRFSILTNVSNDMSSEDRREILRKATARIGKSANPGDTIREWRVWMIFFAESGGRLLLYCKFRAELAKLVATSPMFGRTASVFALDDIEVAGPILKHSRALSDATLLQVIAKNSQPHMMAVTKRHEISSAISHALVEAGDDDVVVSLLSNAKAKIAHDTFEAVAVRAQTTAALQAPLIRREDLPVEMLNDLYLEVEQRLSGWKSSPSSIPSLAKKLTRPSSAVGIGSQSRTAVFRMILEQHKRASVISPAADFSPRLGWQPFCGKVPKDVQPSTLLLPSLQMWNLT